MTSAGFDVSDGATLNVSRHDEPGAVATVILLHGYACDHRCWHRVVEVLPKAVEQPIRVLAYDQRGHGSSSRASPRTATMPQLGDDLADIVTGLSIGPVVLVGHGMGGLAVLAMAARHPSLFTDRVAGVVLLSTAASWMETSAALTGKLAAELEIILGSRIVRQVRRHVDKAVTAGLRWLLFGEHANADDVRLVADMVNRHWPHTAALFRPELSAIDLEKALSIASDMPRLILTGQRDRLVPATQQTTSIDDATVLPGLGHMLPLEGAAMITPRIVAMVHQAIRRA
jgi:pimeloyl-ACP methyl ester carboxylesterase